MKWDHLFINMCDCIAQKSKDLSTKVGAVIVSQDNKVRSVGFNGFPRGAIDKVDNDAYIQLCKLHKKKNGSVDTVAVKQHLADIMSKRYERPLKYKWTEHAERNAIYNAEMTLKGCKIYINSLPPCCDCARAIIQAGIVEVITVENEIPERWKEDCTIALEMLRECNVYIREGNENNI